MKISRFRMNKTELQPVADYLADHLSFDYQNKGQDMMVMVSEKFYLRNNSTQLNMVVLRKENSSVMVDVIGGGGGTGILNISFWSEKGYIQKVKKILDNYSDHLNLVLENVD